MQFLDPDPETGDSDLAPELDEIAFGVAIIEPKTGALVTCNAYAKSHAHLLATSLPSEARVRRTSGEPLKAQDLPRVRATRGEVFRGDFLEWTQDGRAHRYWVSSAALQRGARSLVQLAFVDVDGAGERGAAQSDLSQDQFLSIAAHELRSPLAAVQLVLERLKMLAARGAALSVEETTSLLERGLRQTARLSMLVQNLLDASRIRSKRFYLDLEDFDICALIQEVIEQFRDQAERTGAQVQLTSACESVVVSWDRARIEQVLSNLVSNAIKYGKGSPISIGLCVDADAVHFTISDHGLGIGPEDLQRIFQPFERANSAHRSQSLGLGLYIVRQIVEAHGGTISVESKLGLGASFVVVLPVHAPCPPPPAR